MLAYSVLAEVFFSGLYTVALPLSFYVVFPQGVYMERERERGTLVPFSSSY